MTWGGFNWKLNFRWYPVPQRELDRRGGDRSQPVRLVFVLCPHKPADILGLPSFDHLSVHHTLICLSI